MTGYKCACSQPGPGAWAWSPGQAYIRECHPAFQQPRVRRKELQAEGWESARARRPAAGTAITFLGADENYHTLQGHAACG